MLHAGGVRTNDLLHAGGVRTEVNGNNLKS
jgi:hypothetical protein